jgi:hypothetical protein
MVGLVLLVLVFAPMALGWLGGRFTDWSRRKSILLLPSPAPLLIAALCIYRAGEAMLAPAAQCGVDACGFAELAALLGLAVALFGYAIGQWTAALAFHHGRRTRLNTSAGGAKT